VREVCNVFISRELPTLDEVLRCLDTLDELANSLERVVQTLATEDDSAIDEEFRRRNPARRATRPAPRRVAFMKANGEGLRHGGWTSPRASSPIGGLLMSGRRSTCDSGEPDLW
jgi:hypothetical protein